MIYYGDDNTRKVIKILMVFLLSVPLLISPAAAWDLPTHQNIASKVYYSLPSSVQHNLNLAKMKEGSIAPDAVFKDLSKHQYPATIAQAQNWLNKGKTAYQNKNYSYASYCFGVASHYIADSFSAPHCITGESLSLHYAYEKQAVDMTPSIRYMSGTVNSILYNGYLQNQIDWPFWLVTKSPSIPQRDLNNAGSAAYSLIKNSI